MKKHISRKGVYSNWVQTNLEHVPELLELQMQHPQAGSILSFLTYHMDNYNSVVCSSKVLEEYFKVSRTTIYRAVKVLQDKGFIFVTKSGNTNVYSVNDQVYWKNYADRLYLSKFPANVLLTRSEQFEPMGKLEFEKKKTIKYRKKRYTE